MINKIKGFIAKLKNSQRPGRWFLARILFKSGLHKLFIIQRNGYKLRFSKSNLAFQFFVNPLDRDDDELFLKRILKSGDVYVDVGANIGTLVLSASGLVGSKGKIIGIEAHPGTFKHLKENVRLNKFRNIFLINTGVGNKKGTIFFSNTNADDENKVLSNKQNSIEVKLDKLDNLLAEENFINLLKIDVEGYEKFVLEGSTATLQKTSLVFFESWEKHFNGFGYSTSEVLNMFYVNGFTVFRLSNDFLELLSLEYKSLNCENLLAVKDTEVFCAQYNFTVTP